MSTPLIRPQQPPDRAGASIVEKDLLERLSRAKQGENVPQIVRGVLDLYSDGHGKEGAQAKARELLSWCLHEGIAVPPGAYHAAGAALPNGTTPVARDAFSGNDVGYRPRERERFTGRLHDFALDGVAGDLIRALRPSTEASDAAMLAHLLVAFSTCAGPLPVLRLGTEVFPARLFSVVVGPTGRGRKGTAWGAVRYPMERAYPTLRSLIRSTIQSGEALVEAVRDGTGPDDPGIEDKRLLWAETEYHNVLSVKRRQASILTGMIRDAWDYGDLHNGTKKPSHATNPHVCMIGHITPEELVSSVTQVDGYNGMLNRFLFIYSEAARCLPVPKPVPDSVINPLLNRLNKAVYAAHQPGEVTMTGEVEALYRSCLYAQLQARGSGLLAALQVRSTAYMWRLALVYTLLDCRREIRLRDVAAACAVWQYHVDTVRFVFGTRTGNTIADRIAVELQSRGEMPRSDVSALLGRNKSAAEINEALHLLVESGAASYELRPTEGRPAEVWMWNGYEGNEKRGDTGLLSSFSYPFADEQTAPRSAA